MEVVDTLRKKDEFVQESRKNVSIDEVIGVLEDIFEQLDDDGISCEAFRRESPELLENNP